MSTEGATATGVAAVLASSDMPRDVGYPSDEESKRDQRQDSVGQAREEDDEEDDGNRERARGGHP